jgi:DNA-binding transcriptional LysR family regulator
MTINLTRFDLTTLRLFVLVVDGGSLTAGAAGFGISVAAASKRVAELEAHVGEALLERSKRGVVPTAAGRSAAAPRDRTGGPAAAAGRGDGRLPARRRRHLRLWANTSAFSGFLPDLLAAYMKAHPDVVLDLEDALSEDAARAQWPRALPNWRSSARTRPPTACTASCATPTQLVVIVPAAHRVWQG